MVLVVMSTFFIQQSNKNKAEIKRLLDAANDLKNIPQDTHLRPSHACISSTIHINH